MTENNNTQQFIENLAEHEKVSPQKIKEVIIDSFRQSYCQNENAAADLHFDFTDNLLVFRRYKLVEQVNDPNREICFSDEQLVRGKKENGFFFLPLDIKNFSFSLNHEIKKQLGKNLREIQQEKQSKAFKSLEREIIPGKISSLTEKYCLVNLDTGWGRWEREEWVLFNRPILGKSLYFLIREVQTKTEDNLPAIILTRSNDFDNLFLRKIFDLEVPEIKKGLIIIRHILRLPGLISKIIVEKGEEVIKKKLDIDLRGSCIGEESKRIRSIRGHISPERVEIAEWNEDRKTLLYNLLLPTEVFSLIEKKDSWEVIVPQKSASLREEKILTTISDYLGKKIHITVFEEIEKEKNRVIVWNTGILPDSESFSKKNKYERKPRR